MISETVRNLANVQSENTRTNWSENLSNYIEDFQLHISGKEDGGYRQNTPKTYQ